VSSDGVTFFHFTKNSAGSEVKCNLHVLSVVLCGFETLSLTLREEHGLRCSGRKMEEVTGSGRKSRNWELVIFVLLA
jgi:hypothetical protein